eukprot:8006744-Lingulodinium_polyedra.AAC.1
MLPACCVNAAFECCLTAMWLQFDAVWWHALLLVCRWLAVGELCDGCLAAARESRWVLYDCRFAA